MGRRVKQANRDLSRGYNTKDDAISLAENQATSLINAYPSKGSVKPREGLNRFSTAQFPDDVYFLTKYEDDDHEETVIGILNDGSVWAILKNNPNPFKISDSLGIPTGKIHSVFADSSIFVFGEQREFNVIIEQNLDDSPYFSLRSNYVFNLNRNNPNPILQNSRWAVQVDHASTNIAFQPSSGFSSGEKLSSSQSYQVEIKRNPKRFMYRGWAWTLVRREDGDGLWPSGQPKQTTLFNPGVIESDLDIDDDMRFYAFRRDPENLDSSQHKVEEIDYVGAGVAMNEGDYIKAENSFAKATKTTTSAVSDVFDISNNDTSFKVGNYVLYEPRINGYDENGDPSFKVELPRRPDGSALQPEDIDPQVTHFRLYTTLDRETEIEARGAVFRFVVDVPVQKAFESWPFYDGVQVPPFYMDQTTEGELQGSDNQPVTIGASAPPLGKFSYYHKSRIWIGESEGLPGRSFPSQLPNDAVQFKKFLTTFFPEQEWIDTNQNTGDSLMGIAETSDHLIFLMRKSIFALFGGNPDSGPTRLSTTRGCPFSGSIVQVENTVYYLSAEGPAAIQGRKVILIDSFTAGETWPKVGANELLPESSRKNIFQITKEERDTLKAFYHKDTYFFTYQYDDFIAGEIVRKSAIIGFYASPIGDAMGPFSVEFEFDPANFIGHVVQFSEDRTVIIPWESEGLENNRAFNFLESGTRTDVGVNFYVDCRSKRFYADPGDRTINGQAWDLILFARYEDSKDMEVIVYVDLEGVIASSGYLEHASDNSQSLETAYRHNIQFGFPEGVYGNFFEVRWRKLYDSDFQMFGFDFRYHLVKGAIPKFTTTESKILIDIGSDGVGFDTIEAECDPLKVYPPGANDGYPNT